MTRSPLLRIVVAAVLVLPLLTPVAAAAPAAPVAPATSEIRFTTSDGVELQATLRGEGPLAPRPVIVEFSPYGPGSATLDPGPDFNLLLVEIRGTGRSDGQFDALGPRTQLDVVEVLDWACGQEWSDGRLGLNGFSASAITIYNSLHHGLPCVKGAVMKSGTYELYRDLLYPGGVQNLVPIAAVLGAIGAASAAQGLGRLDDPATILDVLQGQLSSVTEGRAHPTQDEFWLERGFRGDVNDASPSRRVQLRPSS